MANNSEKGQKTKKGIYELILSLLSCFAFVFTIFFYIPYETLATNTISMDFPLSAAVKVFAVVALCLFAVLFLILTLLRGKAWQITTSLLAGLAFASYIQATFLNSGIGSLNGDAIDWGALTGQAILSIVIWAVIIIGVYVVLFVLPKAWKPVIAIVCVMALVMQFAGFFGVLFSGDNKKDTEIEYVLTDENMVTYSSNKNVIIFCLDRLDQSYIEDVEKRDSNFFSDLDGFIEYVDATSGFYRTIPGANYLMTTYNETAYKVPLTTFLDQSWNYEDRHILNDLNSNGIRIGLHEEYKVFFGDATPYVDMVDNLIDANANIDKVRLFQNVMKLTMFRIMPTFFKKGFWMNTTEVNEGVVIDVPAHSDDEVKFDEIIDQMELTNDKGCLRFYHFIGSHAPYRLDENGNELPGGKESDSTTQTMGSFNIVKRALNKMKELGIYDDSTIIITGDHGKITYDSRPLTKAERLGMFYKAPGSTGKLMKSEQPVSQDNIPPTILRDLKLDYEKYGLPLDKVSRDNTPLRYSQKTVTVDGKERELVTYEIKGKAADWNNWTIIKDENIKFSYN